MLFHLAHFSAEGKMTFLCGIGHKELKREVRRWEN